MESSQLRALHAGVQSLFIARKQLTGRHELTSGQCSALSAVLRELGVNIDVSSITELRPVEVLNHLARQLNVEVQNEFDGCFQLINCTGGVCVVSSAAIVLEINGGYQFEFNGLLVSVVSD